MSRVIMGALFAAALVTPSLVGWADQTPSSADPAASQAASADADDEKKLTVEAEIVVTAARIEIPLQQYPAATTVVGEAELSAMPKAVGADEALELVPGVKVDNQLNGEKVHLSIRGQGLLTERGVRGVKVLLDELPLNNPTGFAPDLYDVDWATVNRVEVCAAPPPPCTGAAHPAAISTSPPATAGPTHSGGR